MLKTIIGTVGIITLLMVSSCGNYSQGCTTEEKTVRAKIVSHDYDNHGLKITIFLDEDGRQHTRRKYLGNIGDSLPLLVETEKCYSTERSL
jgi:hypothetical protein